MSDRIQAAAPDLEAPGAGLPKREEALLRYLLMPVATRMLPWRWALAWFRREGERLISLAQGLDDQALMQRVLVPRMLAIEDSSRYWSVAMCLEHLVIVDRGIADIAVSLSQGRAYPRAVSIAEVKPDPASGREQMARFGQSMQAFEQRMAGEIENRRSRLSHPHPWLGELTAHQWVCLAAIHHRLHRKQAVRICRLLPGGGS